MGKYGAQVQSLLKRAAGMEIQMICPLHGPIWRENLEWFLEKYQRWSTYTPEDRGVAIFCGSIYGHTENAAEILAARLAERGVKNIALYDVSHTDVSYLVSEAFRCSHLVLASATYNGEIYTPMENFLRDLACHGLRGRSVALIENGTWAARSGMLMTKLLEEMKEMRVMEGTVTLKSSVKEAQRRAGVLADRLADELSIERMRKYPCRSSGGGIFRFQGPKGAEKTARRDLRRAVFLYGNFLLYNSVIPASSHVFMVSASHRLT